MSSTINASTASGGGVITSADASGILQLQTAGVTGLTIDASQNVTLAKGLTLGASAAPAFSAYQSSAQAVTNGATTKVQFQTEEFDTASCFDNVTNYRFTPNVAGYYQVEGLVTTAATPNQCYGNCSIYKNGTLFKTGASSYALTGATVGSNISILVYLNGSTDYIELYNVLVGASINLNATLNATYFQAFLARSA